MNTRSFLLSIILLASALLGACSTTSNIPTAIRTPLPNDIRADKVHQAEGSLNNSRVRWGGEIISVNNLKDETRIEILSQHLNKSGKPTNGKSRGRFIARIKGFLEPKDYPKKRKITVVGQIEKVIEKPVGDFPYHYPLVKVDTFYLWPKKKQYRQPRYYDPFYYPYWHKYPYYYYW
jgi:outer membrane lipoprotein